ncbi:putative thermosensitive gluconokinase [Venturia nashicola]|uniref:Putative thermosensitive gluconokinase n=1 Tax=Venturia nashicola TaxID=86259 RepID=A0A4Z1NTQ0_9PEZI|nr:putative thermosensitive gluconokinase [Venturia nashicola]
MSASESKVEVQDHLQQSLPQSRVKQRQEASTEQREVPDSSSHGSGLLNQVEPPEIRIMMRDYRAVISLYHISKPARDAIQHVLIAKSVGPFFVVIQVTSDQLWRRTLGAEKPDLARRIMDHKIADIEVPGEEKRDVILVYLMWDEDSLFVEKMGRVGEMVALGM